MKITYPIKQFNVRYGASFQRNGDNFLDLLNDKSEGLTLVHATMQPRGSSGPRFAYCWIESDGQVLDFTSGGEVRAAKSEWAVCWDVEQSFRYTGRAAAARIAEEGHWGPWDFEDPNADLALPERPGRFNPRALNRPVIRATAATEHAFALSCQRDRRRPVICPKLADAWAEEEGCFKALLEVLGLDPVEHGLDFDCVVELGHFVRDLASNPGLEDAEIERYIRRWPDVEVEA